MPAELPLAENTLFLEMVRLWDEMVAEYGPDTTQPFAIAPLWHDEAPPKSLYPRAILTDLGDIPMKGSWDVRPNVGTPAIAEAQCKIEYFAVASEEVISQIRTIILDWFKPDKFNLPQAFTRRISSRIIGVQPRLSQGKKVYCVEVIYKSTYSPRV